MAQTGMARAIYPVHTPLDGDIVFAAATGRKPLNDPFIAVSELGAIAANTLARAIARAVFAAGPCPSRAHCRAGRTNSVASIGVLDPASIVHKYVQRR